MTEQEALTKLQQLDALAGDNERAHVACDALMVEFIRSQGFTRFAAAVERRGRATPFWYA